MHPLIETRLINCKVSEGKGGMSSQYLVQGNGKNTLKKKKKKAFFFVPIIILCENDKRNLLRGSSPVVSFLFL